jgi:hypothetical protein
MWCNARWLKLEAAIVVLRKVGGGAVVKFDHPNKYYDPSLLPYIFFVNNAELINFEKPAPFLRI